MSASPAASLTAVSKGNAHPSRGLAQPIRERIGIGAWEAGLLQAGVVQVPPRTIVPRTAPASADHKRISLRIDQQQSLQLRLASTHLGKSRQAILFEALDYYIKQVVPGLLSNPCPCIENGAARGGDCCERAAAS
jgi:hypothetical protein